VQPVVKRAVVLGGTGAVGSAVLRELARRGIRASYSVHHSTTRFAEHDAFEVDLADPVATRRALDALPPTDVAIHCAAVSEAIALDDIGPSAWQHAMAVNVHSAHVLAQWLAAQDAPRGGSGAKDLVLVGGLDRAQSLPLPVHFATTQGALSALVMALGHELGPRQIRVNLVALGVLDAGISKGLATRRRKDYETFSALRRQGTPDEAAKAIAWLALENTYIQGKVISVNGGI
jgi:3-oxoacyl-[acyl-carrier protein] reductase